MRGTSVINKNLVDVYIRQSSLISFISILWNNLWFVYKIKNQRKDNNRE